MNITLDYYKIFYYVAKTGQITLAARELSISQPAVSQAIKLLESQLDTRLLVRTPKGVTLTSEGQLLYDYVSRGYEIIQQGEAKLMQMKNLETGEIHIGASDMTLRFYLLPYLEKFHQHHPGIKVSVSNAPTPETLQYLREGRIDFGIVSTPFPQQPYFNIQYVKEISDIFVAGSRFAHLRRKTLTCADLARLPLICLEQNTSTRKSMDFWLQSENVQIQPEFELATSDMIVQFALRNLGIGYVMRGFAEEYLLSEDSQTSDKISLRPGTLFPLRLEHPTPARSLCIVTNKKRPASAAAGRLLSMLM